MSHTNHPARRPLASHRRRAHARLSRRSLGGAARHPAGQCRRLPPAAQLRHAPPPGARLFAGRHGRPWQGRPVPHQHQPSRVTRRNPSPIHGAAGALLQIAPSSPPPSPSCSPRSGRCARRRRGPRRGCCNNLLPYRAANDSFTSGHLDDTLRDLWDACCTVALVKRTGGGHRPLGRRHWPRGAIAHPRPRRRLRPRRRQQ